ncbi:uncharacterized protein LOC141611302 [Silene latifolia]|uniref:uncharacterized protein LOC141611302 n=1 Tax=Silene latifolia TaxID=37657 RepID=UPI003D78556C
MGCATSKIDDLPAVILCRQRLDYLNQSLHHRYALSDCHLSYSHSLRSLGDTLHHFFDAASTLPPPVVTKLPQNDNVLSAPPRHSSSSGHLSHSDDSGGSHLHFHSDSDHEPNNHHHNNNGGHIEDISDSGSDIGSPGHHHISNSNMNSNSTYPYPYPYPYPGEGGGGVGGGGGGFMQMNYMKKHVTQSVSYEQRPVYSETIQYGEASTSNATPFYYPNQFNQINYSNPYGYGNYGGDNGVPRGGGGGGASTSKAAAAAVVPPPPPPATSAWDFLNPFESIESSYPPYTPSSRDSREVREEEGIPELEDEDFDHEVVKEVLHSHQKLVDESHVGRPSTSSGGGGGGGKGGERESDVREVESIESISDDEDDDEGGVREVREGKGENGMEYEVRMVDKKVVGDEVGKAEQTGKGGGGRGGGGGGFKNVYEVVKEIQIQFERAATAGDHLTKVLEVGKLRYQRKNPAFQVSTKMLNVITPSLPSTSKDSVASVDGDDDVQLRSINLSASLQKLYLWEKKLYEEVKAEEKMRVSHDRKVRKLKQMDERGAEPSKIESTKSVVRSLSTKINIAIQIVDRISAKINKVRDEELWPQLNELILGLSQMWKDMLECHRTQCQAIDAARGLDAIAFPDNPSDMHLEATLQLEHDLINWTCRFTEWVGAQKGFVSALNNWLFKCLLYEPEETADGIAPFSPGRAGAPPIFVICNQWNQSLDRISETSEKEVITSMRGFAMMAWRFRERDKGEMKQRMTANRDIERKIKNLDREDMKIQKKIQALDKKMELTSGPTDGLSLSGHVVYQSDTSSKTSLQGGLRSIFEALERFTADSVKAYEELLQRIEEVVGRHGTVS